MVFTSLWWNFTLLSCHHDGTRLVFVVLDYNNNMQNLCRPTWLWNVDFRVSTTGNLSPQYCYRPTVLSPLLLTVPHQSAQSKHHSFETALLYIYDHLINATGSQKISCLCSWYLAATFDTIDHILYIKIIKSRYVNVNANHQFI